MSAEAARPATVPAASLVLAVGGPPPLALEALLPDLSLQHIAATDGLLQLPPYARPGAIVVDASGPEAARWPDILPLLRRHQGLEQAHWQLLAPPALWPALQEAGADAVLPPETPPALLAGWVRSALRRVAEDEALRYQLRQVEEALEGWEHEERVRDQLVHMLVHDLKNPITAILGLLEVVADDPRLPLDAKDLLGVACDETSHLLHLSLNMLDVRKIQAGKMHLRRELISREALQDIIQQAMSDVGASLSDRQVSITLGDMPPLSADPTTLRRILANLLSNALKHTSQGGRIWLETHAEGAELRLSVADNGEGIPAEDIPRLFAAFEQSRLTLHGRFDTGMGLAFCKLAAEEHGGRIWVESERGKGARFTLALPLTAPLPATDDDDLLF